MLGPAKERKWGSSGSAQPHSRLPSALKRSSAAETDGRWARPPSAIRPPSALRPPSTRPDSRRSRPGSRMESRPDSRLDSTRPKSGVRPLSGKVYMRRTNDHGWVAKAYNVSEQMRVQSQLELDMFDDLSDGGSLDSFFDDDFDEQTSEEKLGPLLSCNTLGVEAKGNRPDWVSGKLGLPEFHCPRCRDHWYGVTDVPCDEELARLIREGLWRTGKEEGGGGETKHRRRREHVKGDKDKDYRSYSSDSLTSKSSNTRLNRNNESWESKGQYESSLTNEEKNVKNPKKRITFKLDNEFESSGSNSSSNTQLDSGARRGRGVKHYGDRLLSSDGRQSEISNGTGEPASSANSVKYDGGDGAGRDFRDGGKTGGGDVTGKQRKGARNSSEQLDFDNSDLLDNTGERKKKVGKDSNGSFSGLTRFSGQVSNESGGDEQKRHGSQGEGAAYETESGNNHSRKYEEKKLEKNSLNNTSDDLNTSNRAGDNSTDVVNYDNGGAGQTRGGHKVGGTGLSSSSQARSTDSRRGSVPMDDRGKYVRKPGGYMRAVSPSASDWGDPTHAISFISSTATSRSVSRTGSLVNLGGADEEEEEQRISLPPIIPAISSKKPLLDLSDVMEGFQFTRAWTFSYHK